MVERETILLVEDAENWRDILSRVLKRKGQIKTVASVDEAREAIKAGGLTRIITDGLQGDWEEVYKLAKEAGIPLKVLSASSDVANKAREQNVPFVDKFDVSTGKIKAEEL